MKETTLNEILMLITKAGPISAAQISSRMNLTPADIRYHLSRLVQLKLIHRLPADHTQLPGRPATRYVTISGNATLAENPLFLALMKMLPEMLTGAASNQFSSTISSVFNLASLKGLGRVQRILAVVELFSRMGYEANWEARPNTPLFILNHCPYLSLLGSYPACCEFDRTVLALALPGPVKLIRTRLSRIDLPCQFSFQS